MVSSPDSTPVKPSPFQSFPNGVERAGNALPHPATLFAGLALPVLVLSWLLHSPGVSGQNPATGKVVAVVNLLSLDGLHRVLLEPVKNFLAYPPLGISLFCLLGIGIAEHSGLMGACLRLAVLASPARLITPMVVFAGVMSNAGSAVGYVLLTPLPAALFHAIGRHPLAGLSAAFAGVSGGYSANLLVSSVDGLLAGLSEAAAHLINPKYTVAATVNLLISSASAKWALLAPVFVPMFMPLGCSPELVQAAFRVGDSVTNPTSATGPGICDFSADRRAQVIAVT